MHRANRPLLVTVVAALLVLLAAALVYRHLHPPLPGPGSPAYAHMVSAFYTGLLAMNVGDDQTAEASLRQATQIVPGEPSAWADLGLYELRHDNDAPARQDIERALALAPDSPAVVTYEGYIARADGRYADAMADFRRAVQLNPLDLRARYALVDAIEQQAGPDADAQTREQLQAILTAQPDNIFIRIELGRLAARTGDAALLRQTVAQIRPDPTWSAQARARLQAVTAEAARSDTRDAATDLIFLHNLITPTPAFQQAESVVEDAEGTVGAPIDHFLRLPSPSPEPAPPDTRLRFTAEPLAGAPPAPGAGHWSWARSVYLGPSGPASTLLADAHTVAVIGPGGTQATLPFPGGPKATPPGPDGVLPCDWNNEFKMGLVLAGQGGVRIFRQQAGPGGRVAFTDVTAKTKLPASVVNAPYTGAWAEDIDSDGDLDLILGSAAGPPTVLRNNSDGTFTAIHPFPGATDGLTDFAWADLDGDGDPDAAFTDGHGQLRCFQNLRGGAFKEWTPAPDVGTALAVSAVDLGTLHLVPAAGAPGSPAFSLVVVNTSGAISAVTRTGAGWDVRPIMQWPDPPADGSARLTWADLDNNGSLDLLATGSAGSQIWLSGSPGGLASVAAPPGTRLTVDEQDDHGRLDLVGFSAAGAPVRLANRGAKAYGWQQIRLRSKLTADRRNNGYGIGGLIEIRAGLLYADQMVTEPVTHFGLGTAPRADAVRITWPNGVAQGEFALPPDQLAEAPERLKGSCPWLFAWDGHGFDFVTDFLWRSALGLRINAQSTAGVVMTGDWNKIRGDQLVARDGCYDLRLTTQLWETYFFDYIALMTVDHPIGTDIWVDERFSVPPPRLAYRVMSAPHPIARATDDLGHDVTDVLRARDGRYLDTFGLGPYQGITRDHWVQIDLGPDFPAGKRGRQWLLCNGWIHPTDSSINLAISQGRHPAPAGLRIEVPDGRGGWRTAIPNFGFPEGKNKTILIPLSGLFRPGVPHRLRLRTNLEIYWDWIAWATEAPGTPTRAQRLAPSTADLRYHGFDVIRQADASSPETPVYGDNAQLTQRWRDMTGFYTRFGDVRPLLQRVDDRYVIMNAGDELRLRFAAPPPPPPGWTRDFILIGDGWGKDCDHNSGFSKTVLPLPYHADRFYTRPPGPLEDEPAYRMHPRDWLTYQTRYVTPRAFAGAMRPGE